MRYKYGHRKKERINNKKWVYLAGSRQKKSGKKKPHVGKTVKWKKIKGPQKWVAGETLHIRMSRW